MLYGFAALSGFLALLVNKVRLDVSFAAIIGFTIVLTLVGAYLADVKVYDEAAVQAARSKPVVSFLVDLSYKRRIFEVLLDVALVVLAYYTAYTLLYGAISQSDYAWQLFWRTVPILVFVKMFVF